MDRIIQVKVGGNYITKDNKIAGVKGEANVTSLRISFDSGWDGYAKTVTFWDALGENHVKRLLTTDFLEDILLSTRVYLIPIPLEAMTEAGRLTFVIDGYIDGENIGGEYIGGKRQRSVSDRLEVKNAPFIDNTNEPSDPTPEMAEQLQREIETVTGDIQRAVKATQAIVNMSVSAEQLASDDAPFVEKSEIDEAVHLRFGIPEGDKGDTGDKGDKGDTGDTGVYIGNEEPADPLKNVWIDYGGNGDYLGGVYISDNEPTDPFVNAWIKPDDTDGLVLKIKTENGEWVPIPSIKGDKGDSGIESTDCVSGGKGFKITEMGWIDEAEGTGYYVLGNVIGLEAGMVISVSAGISVSGEQTILAVSQSNNKIVVSGYRENSLNTNGDDIENCVVRNYITVVGRPDLGYIDIGFNAVATGQDTMAHDANTFTSGRDTKAIGKYGVALNSNTKAGYACLATGADNEILGVWSFGTGRRNKSCGEGCTILGEEGYISPDAWYSLIGNGQGNKVLAPFGAAFGQGNTVGSANQVVIGVNNDVDENGKYVFVIGNGGYLGEARSNAFTVDWQGNADMRGLKIKGKAIDFNSFATDSDINTVNSRINTTNTNVKNVQSQVSAIDGNITTINSDIVTIENQMTELRTYTRVPQIVGEWTDGTPIYRIAFEKAVTDGNVNLNIIPFINDEGIRLIKSEYISSNGSISSVTDRKEDVTYTEDGGVNIAYTNTGDTIVYGWIEAATSKHNINHVDGDDYYGEYLNSSGAYHLTGEAAHNIKIPVPEELVGKKIKCTLKLKTTHTGGICDLSWGYGEDNIHQISNAAQGTGEFEELTLTTNGKASANEWFKLRFFSWHHDYVDIKDVKVSEVEQ